MRDTCSQVHQLDHALRCQSWSLEQRRKLVMAGPISKENSMKKKFKPFENLSVTQLDQELLGRGVLGKEFYKSDLQSNLTTASWGLSGPAMCFSQPDKSLDDTKLSDYEALPHKPMHGISGHISNLFDEMPHHLEKPPTPKSIKSKQKVLQKSKQTRKSKKNVNPNHQN